MPTMTEIESCCATSLGCACNTKPKPMRNEMKSARRPFTMPPRAQGTYHHMLKEPTTQQPIFPA